MSGFLSSMVGATYQAAAFTAAGQAISSASIKNPYGDYVQSKLAYVGPDSSNRPVFAFGFANASGYPRITLFRVNDDGTVTEGSAQGSDSFVINGSFPLTGEYDGAGFYNTGSPTEYFYGCYTRDSDLRMFVRAFQADRDNLTCTFGTAVSSALTSDSAQQSCSYLGNSNAAFATRTGGGYGAVRYSRSGTTLTLQGSQGGDMGQRIDSNFVAFLNNGSTQYRYAWAGTGNGDSQVAYGAGSLGSTNYTGTPAYIASPARRAVGTVASATTLAFMYYDGSTGYSLRALGITWNASSAPSTTLGSVTNTVTDVYANPSMAAGYSADTFYLIYNNSATNVVYRACSVSGTTVTMGSAVSIATLPATAYRMEPAVAKIGTKTYMAGVTQPSSGSTAGVFGYRLT